MISKDLFILRESKRINEDNDGSSIHINCVEEIDKNNMFIPEVKILKLSEILL